MCASAYATQQVSKPDPVIHHHGYGQPIQPLGKVVVQLLEDVVQAATVFVGVVETAVCVRQAPIDLDRPVDGLDDPSDRQGLRVCVQTVSSGRAATGFHQLGLGQLMQDLKSEPRGDGHALSQRSRANGGNPRSRLLGQKAHHTQGVIRFLCDLHVWSPPN